MSTKSVLWKKATFTGALFADGAVELVGAVWDKGQYVKLVLITLHFRTDHGIDERKVRLDLDKKWIIDPITDNAEFDRLMREATEDLAETVADVYQS